jgi:hypothetical protein
MVVGYFDVVSVSIFLNEAHAVLVVDPDAVLSQAISLQGFEGVSRRAKIAKALSCVNLEQLTDCGLLDGLKPPGSDAVEDFLGLGIRKRPNHVYIVYR